MTNLITADFNGTQIFFQNDAYLHATSIATRFGKRVNNYARNEQTKNYIKAITRIRAIDKNQIVIIKKGAPENGGGTWLHPKLAIDFARWLSPEFAVWCDEQIERILHGKAHSNSAQSTKSDRVPLKDAVNMLVARTKGLNYSEAYRMLHQYMGISTVEEITVEQIPQAVEYVHKLALSGELLPKELPEWETKEYKDKHRRCAVALMTAGQEMKIRQDEIMRKMEDTMIEMRELFLKAQKCDGLIHDGLREARLHLCFDDEIMKDGRRLGREHASLR